MSTPDIVEAPGMFSRMISADEILRQGRVPIVDDSPKGLGGIVYSDYTVNLARNDASNPDADRITVRPDRSPPTNEHRMPMSKTVPAPTI